MSKLTKFLDQYGKPEINKSGSESMYYIIQDRKIRISNHLPTNSEKDTLYIFTPDLHTYIVAVNRKLNHYSSFTELKGFLKAYMIITESNHITLAPKFDNAGIIKRDEIIQSLRHKLTEITKSKSKFIPYPDEIFTIKQRKLVKQYQKQIDEFVKLNVNVNPNSL